MSICPSKDIHSIFIDGELPEEFRSEYLAHLEICKKCKQELNELRQLRKAFQEDSSKISLSQTQIDTNYEKLETFIKFKKVTNQQNFFKFAPLMNKLVPTVSAALLIICLLPVGMRQLKHKSAELDVALQNAGIENPFVASKNIQVPFNTNDSLIKSAEYLTSCNLGNIIQDRTQNPDNIYNSFANKLPSNITNNIDYQAEYFANVYNSDEKLYNIAYSPLIGF